MDDFQIGKNLPNLGSFVFPRLLILIFESDLLKEALKFGGKKISFAKIGATQVCPIKPGPDELGLA